VSAVLGGVDMTIDELLKLGRGAVLELDRRVGEMIDIQVNDRIVAKGEIVVVEDRIAVALKELLDAAD
jgi:flagellar motor switch protein FliN